MGHKRKQRNHEEQEEDFVTVRKKRGKGERRIEDK
jgi:hypothetical protein